MTDDLAALHDAETRFQSAFAADDADALDALLHDDVRFTGPDGATIDKATDLALHRAGVIALRSAEELDREVQVVAGVGITRATLHLVGTVNDDDVDLVLAYTRVWAPSAAGWRIVAAHGGSGNGPRPGSGGQA